MKKIAFFVFTIVLGANFLPLSAQSVYLGGVFPTIDHSGMLTKRLEYSLYYFGAFPLLNLKAPNLKNDARFLLFYAEQGLSLNVNAKLSLNASYVYQRENVGQENYINENRLHVQATYKHAAASAQIKHRVRLDNRFIQNRATGKTPYTHRLRYLLGIDFPISAQRTNLYFTAYEEAFFNTYSSASAVYGENWAYAAFGIKLNDHHKIESGPLYITWNTGGKAWLHQFYLQLTWLSRL
jgi:hypothetical protein